MTTDSRFPAGLISASKAGLLIRVNPPLWRRQQECRTLYLSPAAAAWAKTILPKARTDGFFPGSVSPKEQMMLMARDFCAGDEMTPPLPHIMTPPKEGIWRFRTPDLRFVGWFPTKGAYIVSEIELKSHCTAERDQELLDAATQFRAELSIDNPNLRGEKLNELL